MNYGEMKTAMLSFFSFVSQSPFGVAVFDRNMNFLSVSDPWISHLQIESNDVIGRNLYETCPRISNRWKELHARCMAGETLTDDEELPTDGSPAWYRWRMQPWKTNDGSIGGIFVFFEDVTDRRRVEEKEKREKESAAKEIEDLKQALDQSSIVAFTDAKGRITYVNDKFCEISKYSRDELIGNTHAIVNSGYHPKSFFSNLWRTISMGNVWSGEVKNRAKDGTFYWVFTTIVPFLDAERKPYQYVAIRRDITGQKSMADERNKIVSNMQAAIEASRLKSEFLATMSHEIRTPINGVIGMTDLLLDTQLCSTQKDYAQTIKSSAEDLLGVINDILDFSKVEAGRVELEQIPFSLTETLLDLEKVYSHLAGKKDLQFRVEFSKQITHSVRGDVLRIRQVLNNLLSNALKFTSKGQFSLKVFEQRNSVTSRFRFEVSDSGLGIPAETQKKLFEPFTQADASTTRQFGGTGLGLSISKKLVELMGGEIGFQTEVGVGTTFWFEIDLYRSFGEKTSKSNDVIYRMIAGNYSVLVVEDNPINRKLMLEVLRKMGVRSEAAVNGHEAIQRLKNEKFDLVLMDCQMPDMDGFEATRQIRMLGEESYRNITIVALTANATSTDRQRCVDSGMNDYLSKPVSPDILYSTLNFWLNDRRIAKESHLDELGEISHKRLSHLYGDNFRESQLLGELIVMFREVVPPCMVDMETAFHAKDFEALRKLAHRLKSSSATVGANGFARSCEELERRSSQKDNDGCEKFLLQLSEHYPAMMNELEMLISQQ